MLKKGSFSQSFSSIFTKDIKEDITLETKERLGIFYVDFTYTPDTREDKRIGIVTDLTKIPDVDSNVLSDAINKLEKVINHWE